jgi:hypothetical protein
MIPHNRTGRARFRPDAKGVVMTEKTAPIMPGDSARWFDNLKARLAESLPVPTEAREAHFDRIVAAVDALRECGSASDIDAALSEAVSGPDRVSGGRERADVAAVEPRDRQAIEADGILA